MSTHESGDPGPGRDESERDEDTGLDPDSKINLDINLDEWGRVRPTEPGRDFPPRHRAIELTSMSDSEGGFSMYHPDTLEDGDQTWIWTPDETLVMSVEKCR